MRFYILLAGWTIAAGAGIPLIGILNGGLARSVGNPFAATAVMFAVACAAATALSLAFHGAPSWRGLGGAPWPSYTAGLLIGFYALSATIIIPRFGAGSFVTFILLAQLGTAALVDQFGLFGLARQPIDSGRAIGFALILSGIAVMQLSALRRP